MTRFLLPHEMTSAEQKQTLAKTQEASELLWVFAKFYHPTITLNAIANFTANFIFFNSALPNEQYQLFRALLDKAWLLASERRKNESQRPT